ncbi:hypothetical protein M0R45_037436 [Rubus argutus]|uniref:Uncharacterized protein n=1 Tax=Rubus argutus TaxID=59490 RepID=A0AAW1W2T6_RUBAR
MWFICPHIVNCSVLLGAIISWGFLWPFLSQYAGHWYPADLGSNDFKGLYGYKVFIAIALILGDGLYNLIKIISIMLNEMCNESSKQNNLPLVKENLDGESSEVTLEIKGDELSTVHSRSHARLQDRFTSLYLWSCTMFVGQLVGTAMGCVMASTFWLFWTAFDIGSPDGPYKAPYAVIFRDMATLGIEGFSELPEHCLAMCCGFFVAALVINHLS